ncbi:DUF5131 family protein [uncultured Victivallis sp.]|uniref:DUF5131 family protein n=1 Tax=uncultured Victivallis sp. TaxID=354118 RepID=UPI0025914C17|nr:DUF5131 family protein [uncultured Victivallis sp.]
MIDQWKKGAKYWDHAWNPVIGCRKVSEGCKNCWALGMIQRFQMNGNDDPDLMKFEAQTAPHINEDVKNPPKSGVVFVGNMTDLFGEWNTPLEIVHWLLQLNECAVNLVLTKRPDRMIKMLSGINPLRSLWAGFTAENQERYNERIKSFRMLDFPFRWLSTEPLLGPIDMQLQYIAPEDMPFDWVVVGAESGPNRRPCKLEWVESIVRQCREAGVPVFVKQLEIAGKLVKDINLFPEHLQIRQVPWIRKGGK